MCFLVSPIGGFLRQKKMSLFSNEHCAATFDGEREELPFEVPYQPVFNPDIHVCAGLESGIGGSCFVSLPHHLSRIHLQHITFCHFIFFFAGWQWRCACVRGWTRKLVSLWHRFVWIERIILHRLKRVRTNRNLPPIHRWRHWIARHRRVTVHMF